MMASRRRDSTRTIVERRARRAVHAVALMLCALACASPPQTTTVTILHTNDVHARFLEFGRFGSTCREDEAAAGACFGGVARRATAIAAARAEVPSSLLLDAGDQFQGTLFFSRFRGAAASRLMNHLGYDAMVVGNHEFDDGPQTLADFAAALDFPLLATNVDTSDEPLLRDRLARSAVIERDGERYGVVGYITEETPSLSSPGPTLSFASVDETVTEAVRELEDLGVDKIIALSHAGYERDLAVARSISGIDVIVGGHTNTLLSNLAEDAQGPYPTLVTSPAGEPVAVVQAFAWGKYLGRLDLTFDADGVVVSASGEPILLNVQVEPDPTVAEMIGPLAEEVASFSGEVIGSAAVDLRGDERSCRFSECNLGNLIADALLVEGRAAGVEIALHNSGSIRSTIAAGPITIGDVLEVLPFGNTLSTFSLSGSDLRAALEHAVSRAENPGNDGTGRFLQVAGVRYAFRLAEPAGERVQRIEVRSEDGGYVPLDEDRLYKIASNDFSRGGGDDYTILRDGAIDPYDQGRLLSDIVIDFIRDTSPVAPRVEGRLRSLP